MTVLPLHLGALHPVEQALTLLLAFGPFLVLAGVIVVRRRQDARQDARQDDRQDARQDDLGGAPGEAPAAERPQRER